jgi:hypothetical protein
MSGKSKRTGRTVSQVGLVEMESILGAIEQEVVFLYFRNVRRETQIEELPALCLVTMNSEDVMAQF